jgi:hypothetical protein
LSTAVLAILAPDFAVPTTRLARDFFFFAFLAMVCPLCSAFLFDVFFAAGALSRGFRCPFVVFLGAARFFGASGAGITQAGAELFARSPTSGNGKPLIVGCKLGGIKMTDWKTDLDALVREAMALAKSVRVEPPMPRTIVEPNRMPVNPNKSERDEIRQRVSNFKAHQERFAREREEFAASLLKKRMQERS